MASETLKPCPFCGGEAATWDNGLPDTIVACRSCDVQTRWHQSREEAVSVWNRRAAVAELVEAIRDAAKVFEAIGEHTAAEDLRNIFSRHQESSNG